MSMTAAQLPLPITRYLGRFAIRRRLQRLLRAGGLALLFTLIWGIACCLIDRAIALPTTVRLLALAVNIAVAGGLLGRALTLLVARCDWIRLAAEVERREPAWNERLGTVVSRTLGPMQFAGSPELNAALSQQVSEEAQARSAGGLLRWTPAMRPWFAACVIAALGALLFISPVLDMRRLVHRYADPTAPVAPAATTRLFVSPGDVRIPAGETLRILASAQRLEDGSLTLHVRMRDGGLFEQPMASNSEGQFEARITNVEDDVDYFVTGGDARSDSFHAYVLRRPAVTMFDVTLTYPKYTRLAPRRINAARGIIEAPAGTQALIDLHATEPLSAAMMMVGAVAVPTTPTADANVRQVHLMISEDRRFTLRMTSSAGVEGVFRGGVIRAIGDRPPIAVIEPDETHWLASSGRLLIGYQAADDFGLSKLDVEIFHGDHLVRSIAVLIAPNSRQERGVDSVDLKSLQFPADEPIIVRLRAEDESGQSAQSRPLRVDPSEALAPKAAQMITPPAASQPAIAAPMPVDPPGYEQSIQAYFHAISGS